MKKYVCFFHGCSQLGSTPDVNILDENELPDINLYAEYVDVYELAGKGKFLSKTKKKKLGMTFSSDQRK